MVNHQLQRAKNTVYMDWNITGRPLNAFITSANAIVTLPGGHGFKAAQAIVGKNGQYTHQRTNRYRLAKNVVAFSNWTPLFNGESMNIVTVMDQNAFLKGFDKGDIAKSLNVQLPDLAVAVRSIFKKLSKTKRVIQLVEDFKYDLV